MVAGVVHWEPEGRLVLLYTLVWCGHAGADARDVALAQSAVGAAAIPLLDGGLGQSVVRLAGTAVHVVAGVSTLVDHVLVLGRWW